MNSQIILRVAPLFAGATLILSLVGVSTVAADGPHGAGTAQGLSSPQVRPQASAQARTQASAQARTQASAQARTQASAQARTQASAQARGRGSAQGQGAQAAGGDVIATILGLTNTQIQDLRQSGLSLAQIATKQGVDPQKLVDALVAQWSTRIDSRVSTGALTAAEAVTLKSRLAVRAKDMINKTALGGMRGAAVGGGRGTGQGRVAAGSGDCDGTGPMARGHAGAMQP